MELFIISVLTISLAGIVAGQLFHRRDHKLGMEKVKLEMLTKQAELEGQKLKALESSTPKKELSVEEILSERFAKGEISEEEYSKMMDALLKNRK